MRPVVEVNEVGFATYSELTLNNINETGLGEDKSIGHGLQDSASSSQQNIRTRIDMNPARSNHQCWFTRTGAGTDPLPLPSAQRNAIV
ncbi:MAG: hypothetical protein DMF54_11935 [Acidobacteria bacterium]|nr:MAG: hypothetical protein DMF54_11935 [Acidobacteriota bacterium]